MKSLQYSLSREEIEKYATIGFHLAVDNMEKNNILTEEQVKYYYKFTCVVLTRETIYDKLKKFFKKDEEGFDTIKVLAFPIADKGKDE